MGKNKVFPLLLFWIVSGFHSFSQSVVRDDVARLYVSQIGVKESGNNAGEQVRQYQAACGFENQSVAWCACFITWIYRNCNVAVPSSPALAASWVPPDQTVYCKGQKNAFSAHRGDLEALYFPNLGRVAHIGFFHSINAKGIVTCVEGNTNDASMREGDRVMVKKRPLGTIYAIANWIDSDCYTQTQKKYHIMRPGETLYRLSVIYGTTVDEIKRLNGIKDNVVKVGQRIRII